MADSIDERRSTEPSDPARRPLYNDIRDDYDEDFGRIRSPADIARAKVYGPATAFVVIGLLGILGSLVGIVAVVVSQYQGAMRSDERLAIMFVCVALLLVGVSLSAVPIVAGINMLRMQHRGLALTAAFIVTGLAIAGPYGILFFPFGIWALIVLFQPDVRREFR